jgi:hypothetical protein
VLPKRFEIGRRDRRRDVRYPFQGLKERVVIALGAAEAQNIIAIRPDFVFVAVPYVRFEAEIRGPVGADAEILLISVQGRRIQREMIDPGKQEALQRPRQFRFRRDRGTQQNVVGENRPAAERKQQIQRSQLHRQLNIDVDDDQIGVARVSEKLPRSAEHHRAAGDTR